MSHLPLDARAILQHLNELGYRNISGEQLREFLKDLRKLIKYEERLPVQEKEDCFSSLHKRGTISSRAKSDKENAPPKNLMENPQQPSNNCYCSLKDTKSQYDMDREFAGEAIVDMSRIFRDKLLLNDDAPFQASSTTSVRRSRSKTRKPSDRLRPSAESSSSPENRRREKSRKARKSRSVSVGTRASVLVPKRRAKSKSKSDPVALYQYYQKEWKHFRKQIPGELSHPGLRWQIRNKMLEPN